MMSRDSSATSPPPVTLDHLRQLFPYDTYKDSVYIYPDDFDRTPSTTNGLIDILFSDLLDRKVGHFSDRRVAVLFRPGSYHDVNFPVGYWTQVLGLGETPDEVKFTGRLGPHAIPANTDDPVVGSLDTFWRAAENFYTDSTFVYDTSTNQWSVPVGKLSPDGTFPRLYPVNAINEPDTFDAKRGMLWACSQAAPVRRVKVGNNLHLSLGANCASGGFVGNIDVGGYVLLGAQQQFCIRNCDIKQKVNVGAWSTVLVGNQYRADPPEFVPPPTADQSTTIEPLAKVRIEKPFIFVDKSSNKVYLGIPKVDFNSKGARHSSLGNDEKVFIDGKDGVKIINPNHSFDDVQTAASKGCHLILSPGTYNWGKTLKIASRNQVVLGLGMATIQAPTDGTPCIHVASGVGGVRISGVALEASILGTDKYAGSTLLQWGDKDTVDPGDATNPGSIHDLYCFVGGRSLSRDVQVQCMVRLYSGNIVGDNLWLWRADHVKLKPGEEPSNGSEYHLTVPSECKCDTALEVNGDNVLFHGLAAEHTLADNVVWNGMNGTVIFYQNELPYDVSGSEFRDYAGYVVNENAKGHTAKGVGVYSYFRDHDDVHVRSAFRHLPQSSGYYENVFAVWLNGAAGIESVINGKGPRTSEKGRPVLLSKPIAYSDE